MLWLIKEIINFLIKIDLQLKELLNHQIAMLTKTVVHSSSNIVLEFPGRV